MRRMLCCVHALEQKQVHVHAITGDNATKRTISLAIIEFQNQTIVQKGIAYFIIIYMIMTQL